MLGIYKLCVGFAISAVVLATWTADAQDIKAPAPSPSQQATRANGDGSGERGQAPQLQHRNRRYQLHSAEVLELIYPFTPEYNLTVTAHFDAYIPIRCV